MIIYKITNLINGKIYIGKDSKNQKSYYGGGILIKKAIKKYGKKNFTKETIETCLNKEHLNEREIFWVEYYKTSLGKEGCYNVGDGGMGGNNNLKDNPRYLELKKMYTKILEEKARPKIPKGENHPNYGKTSASTGTKWSQEQKQKLSTSLKKSEKFQKVVRSEERCNKISKAQKGKPKSKEFIEKNLLGSNNHMFGKKMSDEHKEKISKSIRNSKKFKDSIQSEERRQKIILANKGRKRSEEVKSKTTGEKNGMFGKSHTKENKLKMSFPLGKNPNAKKIIIENTLTNTKQLFDTVTEASFFLKLHRTTVGIYAKNKKEISLNTIIYYQC